MVVGLHECVIFSVIDVEEQMAIIEQCYMSLCVCVSFGYLTIVYGELSRYYYVLKIL